MALMGDLIKEAATTKAKTEITNAKANAVMGILAAAGGAIKVAADARAEQNSDFIKVPHSSDYYHGKDHLEVARELSAYGFTNITLFDKKKQLFGRSGAVTEISINDKTTFSEGKRFIKDARIVIVFNR